MASIAAQPALERQLEDPLPHLPCSRVVEYGGGQIIYNHDQLSTSFYLVIDGRVKVSRAADDGRQVVVDIYQRDEFFGESVFLKLRDDGEQATALENSKLMTWTKSAVESIIVLRPLLEFALLRILAQRTVDFTERIESFSVDNAALRLARSLIRFSDRLGTPQEDGSVHMMAFPHEFLSQYVGKSREIVTYNMNRFRRNGFVHYSRKGIILRPEAFREWLRQNA